MMANTSTRLADGLVTCTVFVCAELGPLKHDALAADLVARMICRPQEKRLDATEAAQHPLFWDDQKVRVCSCTHKPPNRQRLRL